MFFKTENGDVLDSKIIKDVRVEDIEGEIYEASVQGRIILTTVDEKEYSLLTFPDGICVPYDVIHQIRDIICGRVEHQGIFTARDAELLLWDKDEGDYEYIDGAQMLYDSLYENAAAYMSS